MLSRSWMRNRYAFSPVMTSRNCLQCPVRRGVRGDVELIDSARSHLHHHENVQHPKAGRHGHKKIASQNALCMVANKRPPTLRRRAPNSCVIWHIASHGPRRDPNPQLQQQFSRDALLTPSRIVAGHLGDELLELAGNSRSSSGLRFPPPEQSKALPMPPDESLRFDDRQSLSPGKQFGKQHQNQFAGRLRPTRLDLALQVQGQLLAEEQILGRESTPCPKADHHKPQDVQQETANGQQQVGQASESRHP